MRKFVVAAFLTLLLLLPVSGQDYWKMRTSFHGLIVRPSDTISDNSTGVGYGLRTMFGPERHESSINYDLGFELEKWYRTYDVFDAMMDSLQQIDEIPAGKNIASNDQTGLGFSMLARIKFRNQSSWKPYAGLGGGFYFIQQKREEARQNIDSGLWSVEKVDNYLETKSGGFFFTGVEGSLFLGIEAFLEGRLSYIFDWDKWDDPYLLGGAFGIKYQF